MSLKSLPVRAPISKVLPRKRSVGERIVAALELAAIVRTLSRVLGRRKRRRLPSRRGLLALAGGLLAAIAAAVLAKRKSGGSELPAPPAPAEKPPAPAQKPAVKAEEPPAKADEPTAKADDGPRTEVSEDPVPAAVAAAKKLDDIDADAPNEGGPGHNPDEKNGTTESSA